MPELHPMRRANPRGTAWVPIILIIVAIFFLGNLVLRLAFNIAFGMLHLIFNVVLLLIIVGFVFFVIRGVSRKT